MGQLEELSFISQQRLVAAYTEMIPYVILQIFITDGLSRTAMLPGVEEEAAASQHGRRQLEKSTDQTSLILALLKAMRPKLLRIFQM